MKLICTNKQYSIIEVNPFDLAEQFTLIDLPIFKSIKRHELINLASCSGQCKKQQDKSPNILSMNKQFNQVTFWVVGQVLSHDSPRLRAELISQFVLTAKHLHELSNMHSSYAVVSALLSTPIYRLEKTWHQMRKRHPKEKLQLDQLAEIYSENNNYELLRRHLDSCELPCIPYMGLFSRDIIYINEAHQEGTAQKQISMDKILNSIEKFQLSLYDDLIFNQEINNLLQSSRYIDELQKFVEDENHRRSLELEPQELTSISQKKSALLLASLTSTLQSALTNSNRSGSTSQRGPKPLEYLIDDSRIPHDFSANHNL